MGRVCNILRSGDFRSLFAELGNYGKIWLVCDENVWESAGSLIAGKIADRLLGKSMVKADERHKNLETVQRIIAEMLSGCADRDVFVLGIGGGITTDIAGFVASIYKRGVAFGFVPTTLLAQVDAAIGGKNGVNVLSYKNMAGVIRQPEFTFICPGSLVTLPEKEFRAGIAEMLKTFLIADGAAYREAVELFAQAKEKGRSYAGMLDIIGRFSSRAAEIKSEIVSADIFERGWRKVLNLGHTFAHAVEKVSVGEWSHGDAVAAGIVMAAELAERHGVAQAGLSRRLKADFESIGLPVEAPYAFGELADAMLKDKKARDGKVDFVLPVEPGKVTVVPLDPLRLTDKIG